jgi:eukaryotic-like serine/threonine-protein kinase
MSFEVGQTVGGYEFQSLLHSPNTELAYQVRNHLSGRVEALKLLPPTMCGDRERVDRFLREIKVHAGLLHPNIVTFYNAAELDGQLIMTTELVEGITLAERMKSGPLRWSEVVCHITQVLLALDYAHEQGIIHRNVTPENIIITADATVKLSGFALAKPVSSPGLTQVGAVLGELNYISPEQIRGTRLVDSRADLYSVGVVMYEALTGRLPFDAASQYQIMMAHVNANPLAASAAHRGVPSEFDSILFTALAKEPANRFQSADQFRAHVESVADGLRTRSNRGAANSRDAEFERAEKEHSIPEESPDIRSQEPVRQDYSVPAASDPVDLAPTFGVLASAGLNQRQLVRLGILSVSIGVLIAILLTVVKI